MKERPVIFNGEMVRAILDGRKTQTRRVIANVSPDNCIPLHKPTKTKDGVYTHVMDAPGHGLCPFGQVGDRLWVRETWTPESIDAEDGSYSPDYRATANGQPLDGRWTPSIHMPRWASRTTLEITAVRVERLNDISDGDAIREGCSAADMKSGDCVADVFARLWLSIYGEESWRANPWVWVIEFRRVGGA
ncbi:hypothetical protein V6X57_15815 [Serratia bockelmannii]|uniref:hypothetical protein n=1 Tax=Serratia bockelmannii TaxID=2703793 RepID=UPI002FE641A8